MFILVIVICINIVRLEWSIRRSKCASSEHTETTISKDAKETSFDKYRWKVMDIVCDMFYDSILEYVSPIFFCTHYDLTENAIDSLDLPYIGRTASCGNPIRAVHLALTIILLITLISTATYMLGTKLVDPSGMFYANMYDIFVVALQTIMLGVSVYCEGIPWIPLLVNLLCNLFLFFLCIYIFRKGCITIQRQLNIVTYAVSALTNILSLVGESFPASTRTLSIISVVFIAIALAVAVFLVIIEVLRICISFIYDVTDSDIEMYSSYSDNNILSAARDGQLEKVQFFVSHGKHTIITDLNGRTPLFLALQNEHPEIAELLIKSGADVSKEADDRNHCI